jgi:hypothetical protein
MRKLDLKNYEVEGMLEDGTPKTQTFDVRSSVTGVLFAQPGLNARDVLELDDLRKKIQQDHPEDSVLLEESDYQKILKAFEAFRGFRYMDVELVRRVLNAPEVKVREEEPAK